MDQSPGRQRFSLDTCVAGCALLILLALCAGPGAVRIAAAALAPADDPPLLAGGIAGLTVEETKRVATRETLMAEGRFSQLLYLYGMTFSRDSRWLTFVLDAIPKERRSHQYYVYIVDPASGHRELVLETKAGSEVDCSFAWAGEDTPVLASPDFPDDVLRPARSDGPAWERPLRIRGVDPRPRPGEAGFAFRRREGEHAATLWFLGAEPDAAPAELSPHSSVFGMLTWAPDGARLAFTSPEGVEEGEALWAVAPGSEPTPLVAEPVTDFAWSPDSQAVAVKMDDGNLRVVTAADGAILAEVQGARTYVWAPDASGLVFALPDDATGVEQLSYLPMGGGLQRTLYRSRSAGGWDFGIPRFSPDGSIVYACGSAGVDVTGDGQFFDKADRALFRCDIAADTAEPIKAPGSVPRLVVTEDGRYAVYVVENPEGTWLWALDLTSGAVRELGKAPVERYAYQLAWSRDATWLAIEDDLSLGFARLAVGPPADASSPPP